MQRRLRIAQGVVRARSRWRSRRSRGSPTEHFTIARSERSEDFRKDAFGDDNRVVELLQAIE